MAKMTRTWTGKKNSLPSTTKKELHKNRKTKEEINHRWETNDWNNQIKDFLTDANQ